MEKIIIGFSKPWTFKPYAWLIMTGLNIPYSHTYIKMYSEKYQRWLIYQASGTMVNFMNMETFKEHAQVIEEFELEISPEIRSKVMQFAIDNCGKDYGIKEVFGLMIVRTYEIFGKTIKNPFADGKTTYVCSGLVSEILKDCLNEKLPKDPDDMTPLDTFSLIVDIKQNNINYNK